MKLWHHHNPKVGTNMDPTQTPTDAVAEAEANLQAAREAAAADVEADRKADVTLESLDARLTDLERRHNGGAVE